MNGAIKRGVARSKEAGGWAGVKFQSVYVFIVRSFKDIVGNLRGKSKKAKGFGEGADEGFSTNVETNALMVK